MVYHSRMVYNVVALTAEIGGLFDIITKAFALIGLLINERALAAAMLNQMYFLKLSDKLNPQKGMWKHLTKFTTNLYEIKFNENLWK